MQYKLIITDVVDGENSLDAVNAAAADGWQVQSVTQGRRPNQLLVLMSRTTEST